jgi:hypothetical protein
MSAQGRRKVGFGRSDNMQPNLAETRDTVWPNIYYAEHDCAIAKISLVYAHVSEGEWLFRRIISVRVG